MNSELCGENLCVFLKFPLKEGFLIYGESMENSSTYYIETTAYTGLSSIYDFLYSEIFSKTPLWYYIALTAATIGLTIKILKDVMPPMTKKAKATVHAILLGISIVGFYGFLKAKNAFTNFWRKIIAPTTTLLEFLACVFGTVSLSIELYYDIA